jgi:hypothetical protein
VTPSPASTLWQNRDFKILLAGQGVSALGDAVTLTALPLLVVRRSGVPQVAPAG